MQIGDRRISGVFLRLDTIARARAAFAVHAAVGHCLCRRQGRRCRGLGAGRGFLLRILARLLFFAIASCFSFNGPRCGPDSAKMPVSPLRPRARMRKTRALPVAISGLFRLAFGPPPERVAYRRLTLHALAVLILAREAGRRHQARKSLPMFTPLHI